MKAYFGIICLALIIASCKKADVNLYQSEGTIIGYDLRTCAMCGGLFITIKNDTTKNAPTRYDINKSLQDLGINPNAKFPINVYLNWMRDTTALGQYGYITVTKIKVVN